MMVDCLLSEGAESISNIILYNVSAREPSLAKNTTVNHHQKRSKEPVQLHHNTCQAKSNGLIDDTGRKLCWFNSFHIELNIKVPRLVFILNFAVLAYARVFSLLSCDLGTRLPLFSCVRWRAGWSLWTRLITCSTAYRQKGGSLYATLRALINH